MWLVRLALRRPITIMVIVVAIALSSILAIQRTRIDIFPNLDLPVIYVAQPYGGMSPQQMEGFISYYYEYHFLYINGIESVEAKSIQSTALLRLSFHAARNGVALCDSFRCRDLAGRLSRVLESIAHAIGNTGPGPEPCSSGLRNIARRLIAASLRGKSANHRDQRGPAEIACLWAFTGQRCAGADNRKQYSAGGKCGPRLNQYSGHHRLHGDRHQQSAGYPVASRFGGLHLLARCRGCEGHLGCFGRVCIAERTTNHLHSGDQKAGCFHDHGCE